MHTERLQVMSLLLHRLGLTPVEKRPIGFDLSYWRCETTVCAIGLAALSEYFRNLGLSLRMRDIGFTSHWVPVFNGLEDYLAVMELFDLSRYQAGRLFSPLRYSESDGKNPLAVARRIDSLLQRELAASPGVTVLALTLAGLDDSDEITDAHWIHARELRRDNF